MNESALLIFGAVSGSSLINGVIWLVVIGLICWLLWWLISYIGPPEPFAKVARVIVALIAVIILINFLLGLTDSGGFIKW